MKKITLLLFGIALGASQVFSQQGILTPPFTITFENSTPADAVYYRTDKYASQNTFTDVDSVSNQNPAPYWEVIKGSDDLWANQGKSHPNVDHTMGTDSGLYANIYQHDVDPSPTIEASLLMDTIDLLSNTGSTVLKFFYFSYNDKGSQLFADTSYLKVMAKRISESSFTTIDSMGLTDVNAWTEKIIGLDGYNGDSILIAIEGYLPEISGDRAFLALDDISVYEAIFDIESDTIIFDDPEICATDEQKGNFNVGITNVGTDLIDTVTLEYFVDDVKLGQLGYNFRIAAGASQFLPVFDTLPFDAAGTFDVKTVVSYGDGSSNDANDTITYSYTVNTIPTVPSIDITGDSAICNGDTLVVTASGTGNMIWNNSVDTNALTVKTAGTYSAKAVSAEGCESAYSDSLEVTVNPVPAKPVISKVSNDELSATPVTMDAYRWFKETAFLEETASNALTSGLENNADYTVVVELDGCVSDTSDVYTHTITGLENMAAAGVSVYPNPATSQLSVEAPVGSQITLTSAIGVVVKTDVAVASTTVLNVGDLAKGLYIISVGDVSSTLLIK